MDAGFFSHVMLWITGAITLGGIVFGLGAALALGRGSYKKR